MKKDDVLRIAINLDGEDRRLFLEVQDHLRIKNKTDVLRRLIKWFYDAEVKGK